MKAYLVGGSLPDEYVDLLGRRGRVVKLPPSASVAAPTGTHPDTLIGKIGDKLFVPSSEEAVMKTLDESGIKYAPSSPLGNGYPAECALNFFTVGGFFVAKTDAVAPDALDYARRAGYEIVNVGQGYAHCATAVAGGGVITADAGISARLLRRGVPTLMIKAGDISLPPFEYGFIGGASGMIDDETIMFFGSLDAHPSGREIRAFLSSLGVGIVEGEGKLVDAGGFIALDT